jgi:predicted transcriptional regulator YheO
MRNANYIIPEPLRKTRETILDERKYKSHTIVLVKDRYQHVIGMMCTKKNLCSSKE